jgi:heme/copper-type cytochrome/quinol oxidase subunit 3
MEETKPAVAGTGNAETKPEAGTESAQINLKVRDADGNEVQFKVRSGCRNDWLLSAAVVLATLFLFNESLTFSCSRAVPGEQIKKTTQLKKLMCETVSYSFGIQFIGFSLSLFANESDKFLITSRSPGAYFIHTGMHIAPEW